MRINSPQELKAMQELYGQALGAQRKRILVCAGTGCVAGGSLLIYARLKELMEERGIRCEVVLREEPHEPFHEGAADGTAASPAKDAAGEGQDAPRKRAAATVSAKWDRFCALTRKAFCISK